MNSRRISSVDKLFNKLDKFDWDRVLTETRRDLAVNRAKLRQIGLRKRRLLKAAAVADKYDTDHLASEIRNLVSEENILQSETQFSEFETVVISTFLRLRTKHLLQGRFNSPSSILEKLSAWDIPGIVASEGREDIFSSIVLQILDLPEDPLERVPYLQDVITEGKRNWKAGVTPISKYSRQQFKTLLGAPSPRTIQHSPARTEYKLSATREKGIRIDWSDDESKSYLQPPEDQGLCGSCVAFATAGVLESLIAIKTKMSVFPNLSKAMLFCCGGGSCAKGWTIEEALDYIRSTGIIESRYLEYEWEPDRNGIKCSEEACLSKHEHYRIESWKTITTEDEAKDWIVNSGPIIAAMDISNEFSDYVGGVYYHVNGDFEGSHAIEIIGFDDRERYWICRNSWGPDWGESGYFRIGYGECGILTSYPAYSMVLE